MLNKIYVDADACPVVREIENIARGYNIPVILVCDTNHILNSDYSQIKVIGAGPDAVDFALINMCVKGDVVITQDYGVAAMALSKGAFCINQNGIWYTDQNIDRMLMDRHMTKEVKRSSSRHHMKGPRKRLSEDNKKFSNSLDKLIKSINGSA